MNLYKKLFVYVPESKNNGRAALAFSVISALMTCAGYYFIYKVLDKILMAEDLEAAQRLSLVVMALLTSGGLFYYFSGIFSHKLGFRLETNLRKKGIDGIVDAGFRFFDTHPSGVIRKTIDDNAAMTHQAVAHMIPDLGQAFAVPPMVVLLSFAVSARVGCAVVVSLALGSIFMITMTRGETSFLQLYQDALKRLSGETVEYVRGIQVIKIFKADVRSFKALHEAIMDYAKYACSYSKSCRVPYVTYQWLFLGAAALVTLPLSFFLNTLKSPNFFMIELLMYIFLLGAVYVSMMRIMYASLNAFNAGYAVENLEKLYHEMRRDTLSFGTDGEMENYDIGFQNIDFAYGGKKVFENFSLDLKAGKSYAFVGASGSGKSTLAKLLSGFYRPDGGTVTIGNKPICSYTEDAVTRAISFVFQDPRLFKISIYDNVALGKKGATRQEVMNALQLAGCTDIIDKFPERENTLIGTKGVYLSGGEKGRIAIARAILKDSPILVMDEASAAVDADNEYKLQEAFKNLMKGKTVIMIAHRLSSIKNVDEIIVLKNGKILERGSHDHLLKKGGEYKSLFDRYGAANDWRFSDDQAFQE